MRLLQGIRVLDLGMYIAGPYTAALLGELGADVVKVEMPRRGDPFREFDKDGLYSKEFRSHNRNKRSVSLDYTRPDGLQVLRKLVDTADVFIINSRPGVAEKLGISHEAMREANPRLVYCSITGFGGDGPYAQRPAFDSVGQALSGWASRHRRGDDPRVIGPAIADPVASHYAALGIQAALIDRHRTGKGCLVEVNLLEAMIALGVEPIMSYFATGEVQGVFERPAMSQAYNVTCKDGKRIGLHVSSVDKFWQAMCRALGREDWLAAYPQRMDRVRDYEKLAAELNAIFAQRNREDWTPVLEKAGFPFAPELEIQELEDDPQIRHLGVFYETEHPKFGRVRGPHRPVRANGSREIDFRPPPGLGEHTDEVLREAGIAAENIDDLRRAGVV